MKIRFQADADLNEEIIMGILRREPSIDFQTAHDAGLRGLADWQVLSKAAKEGRVIVTHDRRTMPEQFATFIQTTVSPGVFVISQSVSVPKAIEELLLIWLASETEEWTDSIANLPL